MEYPVLLFFGCSTRILSIFAFRHQNPGSEGRLGPKIPIGIISSCDDAWCNHSTFLSDKPLKEWDINSLISIELLMTVLSWGFVVSTWQTPRRRILESMFFYLFCFVFLIAMLWMSIGHASLASIGTLIVSLILRLVLIVCQSNWRALRAIRRRREDIAWILWKLARARYKDYRDALGAFWEEEYPMLPIAEGTDTSS